MSFASPELIAQELIKEFPDIPTNEINAAVQAGWKELDAVRHDMYKKG